MSVATIDAFHRDPKRFWDFYRPRFHALADKRPNPAHEALAELERRGLLDAVITQNIDRLHSKAGSERVVEVHGSIATASCTSCRRASSSSRSSRCSTPTGLPHCTVLRGQGEAGRGPVRRAAAGGCDGEAQELCARRRPAALRRLLARGLSRSPACRSSPCEAAAGSRSSPRARPRTTPRRGAPRRRRGGRAGRGPRGARLSRAHSARSAWRRRRTRSQIRSVSASSRPARPPRSPRSARSRRATVASRRSRERRQVGLLVGPARPGSSASSASSPARSWSAASRGRAWSRSARARRSERLADVDRLAAGEHRGEPLLRAKRLRRAARAGSAAGPRSPPPSDRPRARRRFRSPS